MRVCAPKCLRESTGTNILQDMMLTKCKISPFVSTHPPSISNVNASLLCKEQIYFTLRIICIGFVYKNSIA